MARYESFLIRVWWRARPGEDQWIGRIEHLRQRKTCNFHDPEALLAYLREMIEPIESSGPPQGAAKQPAIADVLGKSEAFKVDVEEETRVHPKPSRR